MKWMLGLCLAGLAAGAGAQGGARSEVRLGGENTSRVVIEGSVVNRAVGKGAVAETNIAGRRSVVRGDAESSVTVGVPDRPVDLGVDLVNAELAGRDLRGHVFDQRRIANTDLAGAQLRGASFRGSRLTNVDLSGADLTQADLHSAFQDHPVALEHFPSGSLLPPPRILLDRHEALDRKATSPD